MPTPSFTTTLRESENGTVLDVVVRGEVVSSFCEPSPDAPEDHTFDRGLEWVRYALADAFQRGREDHARNPGPYAD